MVAINKNIMIKYKKKVFWISLDPYCQECIVIVNGKLQDLIDLLKKQKTENARKNIAFLEEDKEELAEDIESDTAIGHILHQMPHGYAIFIKQRGWSQTVGIVAHETLHLVFYILTRAGLLLGERSQEAYTYLQEKAIRDILSGIYGRGKE